MQSMPGFRASSKSNYCVSIHESHACTMEKLNVSAMYTRIIMVRNTSRDEFSLIKGSGCNHNGHNNFSKL